MRVTCHWLVSLNPEPISKNPTRWPDISVEIYKNWGNFGFEVEILWFFNIIKWILDDNLKVWKRQSRNIFQFYINSSLIDIILNFKVFGQYLIMLTCLRVPRHIKICSSMRPTKWDQAQVNWTLRSGVRAKNEGKFVFFAVTRTIKFCILPSLSHKLKEMNVFIVVDIFCDGIEDKNQST